MFFTQKNICTKAFFRHIYFYQKKIARILLRREAFTHRCFSTRTHLGRGTLTWVRLEARFGAGFKPCGNQVSSHLVFTERCVYIHGLLHREGPSHRDGFLQRDDFTKGCFYLQMLLHRDTLDTEMLLHTGALKYKYFYTEMILLRETFRHRRVFTQVPLHLYTKMFLHRCFYMLILLQYTVLYAHILLR